MASALAVCLAIVSLVVLTRPRHETTTRQLCSGLDELRRSFDIRVLSGQAGIRRAGAALAVLADEYPEVPQLGAVPVHESAAGLTAVLSARYGTARDLWTAARPVAVACGQDWRSVADSIAALESR